MSDPFNLQRFVDAQAADYITALAEICAGHKRTHWIWYVFPQIAGLGHSEMAQRYGIGSLDEAAAYLNHPILGARLHECVSALQELDNTTAEAVFGELDAKKLRSSLTLFIEAGGGPLFEAALDRWFAGYKDPRTLELLQKGALSSLPRMASL